jgi:hypothetical protein
MTTAIWNVYGWSLYGVGVLDNHQKES